MANVTDCVFRKLFAKYGKPDAMFTEFVSADGLISAGRKRLLIDLEFSQKERPIVAQLFTGHPEAMKKAAALVARLGFDGLDINMGCPDRAVVRQGGGAALMKDPKAAIAVLEAARIGVSEKRLSFRRKPESRVSQITISSDALDPSLRWDDKSRRGDKGIPVSIKTRIGYNQVDLNWIRLLLEQNLPALTIHLRTRKEMSEAPAHWELMPEIIKMRDEIQADIDSGQRTLIIGNGDVTSLEDAALKCEKYGCDGVMIGRGIFGRPWFFEGIKRLRTKKTWKDMSSASLRKSVENFDTFQKSSNRHILTGRSDLNVVAVPEKSPEQRLKIMVEHAKSFEKEFGAKRGKRAVKSFAVMRKHFKAYVNGWDGAKELRAKLMETENAAEVAKIVKEY